jgi:hypothetical protein
MNVRLVGSLILGLSLLAAPSKAEPPDYARQIQPLLNKYCTGCHNDADREGKLSLESHASLLKGGANGASITPGHGELSRLIRVITGKAEPAMPPPDNERPKPEEIALLAAWIDAGAKGPSGAAPDPTQLAVPKIPLTAPVRQFISAVAISPLGDRIALARYGEVEIQSLPERKSLHKLGGLLGSVNGVSFSDDGALLVAAAGEPGILGQAIVWKAADGTLVKEFRGHKDNLYCGRFSPDGKLLATGGYDHQIKLWDIESGKEIKTLEGHNGPVFELAFRHDGQILASCSGDRTLKLWSVPGGERLDTLKESTKELYTLAFSPDGKRIAAAGGDNRIRVWEVSPDGKEGTNPLLRSQFAHEQAVLRIAWSSDGSTIVSTGEERLIKIWNADKMSIRDTLEPQPDWTSGLAVNRDGSQLVAGRLDGSVRLYSLQRLANGADETPIVPLAETPREAEYGPQPPLNELPTVAEAEPNDQPSQATPLSAPGVATGRIFAADRGQAQDYDLFHFQAKQGEQWILETNAARSKSPLDSKLEVLDMAGNPVPRLLLRAVRDVEIEFRGMNGDQRGVRLKNWEELLLNQYVYLGGEVIKHYQQRRGPDGEGQFYPENGARHAFFETSSRAHALGEPGYVVVPYAIGTKLPDNGLPVFTQYFENDDDSQRELGKDSRLTFVPPADGEYLVRVSDVRGFAGEGFSYKLALRRPVPGFTVKLNGDKPALNAGSGRPFSVKADRIDNFMGPIRVDIANVPPGFQATTPLIIPAGLYEAHGVISSLPQIDAAPSDEQCQAIKVTATAAVVGKEVTRDVNNFGRIKLAEQKKVKPEDPAVIAAAKVIVHLERSDSPSPAATGVTPEPNASAEHAFPKPAEITIAPGGSVTCRLRIDRREFKDRVQFDVTNLPHGVIVDDIGLNGILIVEGQTERTIFLRAEPWVPEQSRTFQAIAQVDGNQVSRPMVIHVKK